MEGKAAPLAAAGGYIWLWFSSGQDLRYFVPVLPLLCIALGVGLAQFVRWTQQRRGRFGRTVLAVGIIGAGAYAGYRAVCQMRENGSVFTTPADDRDETLAASFPASDPPPMP